ncbi:MAG: type II secretion system minor pseudopilin GspH [Gammaproteobacteria bacterium]|nr:type II secretion system minor pseudopilin GspH [Gammaproteobacteria bacterium]
MFAKRQSRGFTLIEILVVIVIVGTVLSIVVLSIGIVPEDEELKTERTRLAALMETVQDEAMMQGREFGLEIMTASYRFVEFDPFTREWTDVPNDELYRLRNLPDGVEFELYIDDKRVELQDDPQEITGPNGRAPTPGARAFAPHLYVFASGEASAYELRLVRPLSRKELIMRGDILGEITFGEDDEI